MHLTDLPLSTLIYILIGIGAVFAIFAGIKMPHDFYEGQKLRNELKKKLYSSENEEQNSGIEEDEPQSSDNNQVS